MKEYIEYLKYAIQNSYKEFSEKGFKNLGLLENWLTYNLFFLYRDGNASRFAHKHIKALKKNIENHKDELLNFLITNYIQEIQNKKDKVEEDSELIIKPETQLVGPLEKIINNMSKEKGISVAIDVLRKYLEPKNLEEENETKTNLENEIEIYINNLNVENKDGLKKDYKHTIFFMYSKPDILKMMCASTVRNSLKTPIADISDLKKYDDVAKLKFNQGEIAVVANSLELDKELVDKLVTAMEAIRSGKIEIDYIPEDEQK